MRSIQERVEQAKRDAFLASIADRATAAAGGADCAIGAGELGDRLGLPYEDALGIVDELEREGFVDRGARLDPPTGPAVWLTDLGLVAAERLRAA